MFYVCLYCVAIVADGPKGESWYHKRSVTPISVLKAGHVEHLPQCIFIISISLSLFLTE